MKYEIIKGSEKDFEGFGENVLTVYRVIGHMDYRGSLMPSTYDGATTYRTANAEIIAERRPITEPVVNKQLTTEWDGEGLPPVGVEVDIVDIHERLRYGQNESGEVVAHVENTAVVRMSYGLGCFEAEFLRPTRSPEDVARDEAIGAMERAWENETLIPAVQFEAIYDAIAAGKIPGVKLEDK